MIKHWILINALYELAFNIAHCNSNEPNGYFLDLRITLFDASVTLNSYRHNFSIITL